MIHLITTFIAAMAVIAQAPLRGADENAAESKLMEIKSELPFISVGDFLYHREPRDYTLDGKVKFAWNILLQLDAPELTVEALKKLSQHTNADIRALALLGLVQKESPEVVPVSLRLANDRSTTLPNQQEPGGRSVGDQKVYTVAETVGGIARKILHMVDCRLFWSKDATEAETNEWWAPRKDNEDWLAWHAFLYTRAYQGTSPAQPQAKEAIQQFRKRVDALPARTRSWVLLYLSDDIDLDSENYLITEEEMVEAAKLLGAEALIDFLRNGKRRGLREPALDNPEKGRPFIVTYAPHLFAKEHADALLQMKLYTAAADADPSIVRRVADAGLRDFAGEYQGWDRSKVMAALAALGDDADRATTLKWFYDEPNTEGGSSLQSVFIGEIGRRRPEQWREVVRGIVAHSGFDRLRPVDVMYLALMVERLGGGDKLISAGYRYEEDAEATRGQLRRMFQVKAETKLRTLPPPETFLEGPEWKIELDEWGRSPDLSADGKLLAVDQKDGREVLIIDTDKGTEIARLPMAGRYVQVAFVGSGRELVCGPDEAPGTVLTWPGHGVATTTHDLQTRLSIRPTRRSDRVAAFDTKKIAWLEFPSGKVLWEQEYQNRAYSAFGISPDAALIACNDGWTKDIDIIKTADGRREHRLSGHASSPTRHFFSRDSKRLISTAHDSRLIIWDLAGGKPLVMYHSEYFRFGAAAFGADGESFFASSGRGQIACYSITEGKPHFGIKVSDNGAVFAVPSADGKRLYLLNQYPRPEAPLSMTSKFRLECWKLP